MPDIRDRCESLLAEVQDHLRDELLPYWAERGEDKEHGGFLTYFDRNGKLTGETMKTLVGQTRMIFTFSSLHRANFGDGLFLQKAERGLDFLLDHFWDRDHWGWFWTTEQDGRVINPSKIMYGQCFAIYALSEYAMASGDHRGLEWATKTYEAVHHLATDVAHGGYYEFQERDWTPKRPGEYGGDRKSFDIHMHMMESHTNLFEATGLPIYRRRVEEIVKLIFDRIIHPEYGTGQAQFLLDWTPTRQILFRDVWGSDRDAEDPDGRPLDNTSFGHNTEFAWLLRHTLQILGQDEAPYRDPMRCIYDHCHTHGIDWEKGGVFCEGGHAGGVRESNKEFWQQAEALVGFLDAYLMFEDAKYIDAYENIHRFVMDHVINHKVGEWYPLFDRDNNRLWDYMGHAWKINYHTVRSMVQCEKRLSKIVYGG